MLTKSNKRGFRDRRPCDLRLIPQFCRHDETKERPSGLTPATAVGGGVRGALVAAGCVCRWLPPRVPCDSEARAGVEPACRDLLVPGLTVRPPRLFLHQLR